MAMNGNDWWSCDGNGGRPAGLSRRSMLLGAALTSVGWLTSSALGQIAVRPKREEGRVLVNIFLRGGADGLSLIVPYREDPYHRERPNLGLSAPNDRTGPAAARTLDLDGFFGLHPAMAALLPHFREGRLGAVHAVGSGDQSRSHFEAMGLMERGAGTNAADAGGDGWLARYLEAVPAANPSPLRAVAISGTLPDSLRGATGVTAITSLDRFRLEGKRAAEARRHLAGLYASGEDVLTEAGRETLQVLDILRKFDPQAMPARSGVAYPNSDLGQGLRQVAHLIRADVGLEIACLDKGGWDTHVLQGATVGTLPGHLSDVADSVDAFVRDLGPEMQRVTVVIQTEFGRRLHENASMGTDHGRASVMFAVGAGVKGGQVAGKWPGLAKDQLEEPGDLRVTTDYRNVLAEALRSHGAAEAVGEVFPGHRVKPVGLFA